MNSLSPFARKVIIELLGVSHSLFSMKAVQNPSCSDEDFVWALIEDEKYMMVIHLVAGNGSTNPELCNMCLKRNVWTTAQRQVLEQGAAQK